MEWISVKDIPTPKDKRFLGYGDAICNNCYGKILEICKYDPDYESPVFGEFDCSIDVSHWMPLPEIPRREKI